jgi:hypothetical protein
MAATVRSDVVIPEIFTPYLEEATTLRNAFIASGVVQPLAALDAAEGGDYVNVPFWDANLAGDAEVLSDSGSLTPGNITADKQRGVILHRGRAWGVRELAKLAAGDDPMGAIGNKVASYIAHQQQKDFLATLAGVFGPVGSVNTGAAFIDLTFDAGGSNETPLTPRHVAKARALLGDQGDKLSAICVHSAVYYDLVERRAIDYVTAAEARATALGTAEDAFGGSVAGAYTADDSVPFYMGMRVIVSDDVQTSGAGSSKKYATYFFTPGAVASGEQQGLKTEVDRDILALADYMAVSWHNCYHPMGSQYQTAGGANPSQATLATITNWAKVYETKNIGIVRGTVTSNFD